MSWEDPAGEPPVSLTLRVPHGGLTRHTLDGVAVTTFHDRRRFAAAALQPSAGGSSARERADAWVEAARGGGSRRRSRTTEVVWAENSNLEVVGATRLRGPDGTQPITVALRHAPDLR